MKIIRPTGTLELCESGPLGYAAIALDGHTQRTGGIRIIVDLTPAQALELAGELVKIAAAGLREPAA